MMNHMDVCKLRFWTVFSALLIFSLAFPKAALGATEEEITRLSNEARLDSNSGLAFFNLGRAYDEIGRYPEALLSYEKVSELKSPLAPAALYYEALIYEKENQLEKAKRTITKICSAFLLVRLLTRTFS